jgi:L-threonylcarbamoyladenylate synthase
MGYDLVIHNSWRVAKTARILREGGIVAHATEAVFGLAASVYSASACARVTQLKARGATKNYIVVAQNLAQLGALVLLETPLYTEILASWPGPNTWIFNALPSAPSWLVDADGRLAVRLTAHPQVCALCERAGPLISTSANPAGKAPARNLFQARRYFGNAIDSYLPGQLGGSTRPSTIRDGATGFTIRR